MAVNAKPVAAILRQPGASRGGGDVAKGFWAGGGYDAQYGGVKESDLPGAPSSVRVVTTGVFLFTVTF